MNRKMDIRLSLAPRWGMLLTCALTLGAALPGLAADGRLLRAMEEEIASIVERNRSCVVSIHTVATRRLDLGQNASGVGVTVRHNVGSGVIFDAEGHILTTAEVVRGADQIQVSLASGRMVDADLVATDDDSKVAVVRLRGKVSHCPRFGDSDRVRTGHYAFILGNAYGTMAPSMGTVAEFHDDDDLIQISGYARPGNSGAAVFNSEGRVIGIVRGILAHSSQEEASGADRADEGAWDAVPATLLAIPINQAQEVARRLISGAWLGVEVVFDRRGDALTSQTRGEGPQGSDAPPYADPVVTKISRVVADGPAERAGLRPGDVITSYNDQKVVDGYHLARLVRETPVGREVQIGLLRGEQPLSVQVRLGQRSGQAPQKTPPPVAYGPARRSPETPEMLLQRLRSLDPQTLRDLQMQMQMLIQQQEGKKEK
jgi:S1-C subfamily serine protease